MEYSIEMVETILALSNSIEGFVSTVKGGRWRYVVSLTRNGTSRTPERIVEQLQKFDHLPVLCLNVDTVRDGVEVEVATRFDEPKDAIDCAHRYGQTVIYDSFRDKPVVLIDKRE